MIKTLDTCNIFDLLHKVLAQAADLYSDGDKSQIRIASNSTGEIEVYAKSELIERPFFDTHARFLWAGEDDTE